MIKSPVKMESVFKRNVCMSDTREYDQSGCMSYISSKDYIKRRLSIPAVRESVQTLIRNNSTKANANKEGYKYCINILESLNDIPEYSNIFEESFDSFVANVIPYCSDLNSVKDYASRKQLSEECIEKLGSVVKEYKLYDRIVNNHNMLSKRFKIDSLTYSNSYTPLEEVCRNICEMIDTYDQNLHVKMELCFEELCYVCDKNSIKMNEPIMVEAVTDYFLSLPSTKDSNINELFKKTILESKMLSLKADKRVKYLTKDNTVRPYNEFSELEDYGRDTIKDYINKYKLEYDKSYEKFMDLINDIFSQPTTNIVSNIPSILKTIQTFYVLTPIYRPGIIDDIVSRYINFDIYRKDIDFIINHLENEQNVMKYKMSHTTDQDDLDKMSEYYNDLNDGIEQLVNYADTLYTDNEVLNKEDVDVQEESYILEKTQKIIVNTLIQDSIEADKFISSLAKQTLEKDNATKTDEKDELTEESLLRYIDPEGRISVVLCSYDIRSCKLSNVYEAADSIIKSTNNFLYNTKGKVYYTVMENCIDFVFRSKFKLITNLQEDTAKSNTMTDVEIMRISNIVEMASLIESLESMEPNLIVDKAIKKIGSLSIEHASMFIEAWGSGAPIDKEDIERFVNEFVTYQNECGNYIDSYNISNLFKSTTYNENSEPSDIVECTRIMNDIVNEAADLNSLKLALIGFKKKAKNLSAKEQQLSRDLDMNFNNFIRSIQSFYKVTDHRERIIKGQVFPSLSKILKIGISLAGLGVVSGGIVVPAIALVSGLALSKNASDKEKRLIVDEIDIELQVVDRELKRIEDSGKSSRKYRTLLTYQKNLQREKQRILYNLSRKGKSLPISSTKGIKRGGGNDD